MWILSGAIGSKTEKALTEAYNAGFPTYVSPITAWEVSVQARKRRFASTLTPKLWFEKVMALPGAALAQMPPNLLIASNDLPDFPTNDPADRIIAATGRAYGFTVVTRDEALLEYGQRGYLSVLEC